MLGEEFSMLDVAIAPLLWRLDHYGIELSKNAAPLMKTFALNVAPSAMTNIDQRRTEPIDAVDTRPWSHSHLRMLNCYSI